MVQEKWATGCTESKKVPNISQHNAAGSLKKTLLHISNGLLGTDGKENRKLVSNNVSRPACSDIQ